MVFQARAISGMIAGWQRGKAYWTPTGPPGFVQGRRSRGDSAIRRPGLSSWCGGKTNRVRVVWDHSSEFLRSQGPPDSRSVVRGDAHLPGNGDPPGSVSTVWQREAGEGAVGGGQSVLHEAVCLVCGTRRCRETAVKEVARELKLDWKTVKSLEKEYMRDQLRRTGTPSPQAMGIDELSIKKGAYVPDRDQ